MKRWLLPSTATTANALVLQDVEVPEPGAGQVRVRVRAISLNGRDKLILAGPFGRLPGQDVVPLSDVAGEIEALGEGVTGWAVGDRVMTAHVPHWQNRRAPAFGPGVGSLDDDGVAAEQVLVGADSLVAAPQGFDDAEASTLQVAGVTAWNALFGAFPITAEDRVVTIGSGGVAVFATQIARAVGAQVVAVLRNEANSRRHLDLGATRVVPIVDGRWGKRVLELSGGATKVVNTVGAALVNESLAALGNNGEVAVLGLYDTEPPVLDAMSLIGKQASVRGVAVGSAQMHRDLSQFLQKQTIRPIIDRRVPFAHLPEAFEELSSPNIFGKVVVEVP